MRGAAPNNGFDIYASDKTTLQNIITGTSISGDEITISLSGAASAGSFLTFGWGRPGMTAPVNAPYAMGNLRDSETRTTLIGMVQYTLRNYCLLGELQIA